MSDVTEALVDVVLDEVPRPRRSRFQEVLEWLSEITKPPVGVRLVSDDGGAFTGFVIVENNTPLAMLAIRVGTATHRPHMMVTEPTYVRPAHGEPRWRPDEDEPFP